MVADNLHPQAVAQFSALEKLFVNNIAVKSWEEVSKLRWFPALNDVRMVHWDLFGVIRERMGAIYLLTLNRMSANYLFTTY